MATVNVGVDVFLFRDKVQILSHLHLFDWRLKWYGASLWPPSISFWLGPWYFDATLYKGEPR